MTASPPEVRPAAQADGPATDADPRLGERGVVAIGLAVTLLMAGLPEPLRSYYNLDYSWIVGLNAARGEGLQFGRDLVFTYGPGGYLDHPLPLNHAQYVVGIVYGLLAVTATWAVLYAGARRALRPVPAMLVASLVTFVCGTRAEVSAMIVLTCGGYLILRLTGDLPARWRPRLGPIDLAVPFLALVASLLLQVKFSAGVAAIGMVVLACVLGRTWLESALDAAAALGTFLVGFVVFWLALGQDLGDVGAWLRGSGEEAAAYSEAMNTVPLEWLLSYLTAIGLVAVLLYSAWRHREGRTVDRVALVLVVALVVTFGYKAGFTRHDPDHEQYFFTVTAALLVLLAAVGRRMMVWVALVVSLVMVFPPLTQVDVTVHREQWRYALQAVFSARVADIDAEAAKEAGRASYAIPQVIIDAAQGHPVAVDPWDIAVAVDHDLEWAPMPVPQMYAAYTHHLDRMNAEAARDAPADQRIIRMPLTSIDGRNAMWDAPQYALVLACQYGVEHVEGPVTLLQNTGKSICGKPSRAQTQHVDADEQVAVPEGGPGTIVVANFTADKPGLLTRAVWALFRPGNLEATVNDVKFRVPRGFAAGPLMMSYPDRGTDSLFAPFDYRTLSYNRPGTVSFRTIPIGS